MKRFTKCFASLGLGLCLGIPGYAETNEAKILMNTACDSYANAQSLKLKAIISWDNFVATDRKIQKNSVVQISAKRSNKFKAVVQGDEAGAIYYNGSKMTAIDSVKGFFAQSDFSGDLKAFLDHTEKLNQPTPALEFISPQFCKAALEKVTSAEKLAPLMLDGEPVEHLSFVNRSEGIHWEAWLKKSGERYVIKKVVITTASIRQQPQYEYLLVSEELDVEISDKEFEFTVSATDKKVMFLEDLTATNDPRYGTARRVARRTTRRVAYRHASYHYYNDLPYYSTSPAGCAWNGDVYICNGRPFRPVLEGGTTVYVIDR